MIDDATSRLSARFFPRDTGAANRKMIVDYLNSHGRMGALYTDQASHFKNHFRATARREQDKEEALTLIRRALDSIEIELILALSPQAKGRVERLFKTLQDRLIKEMRVAGISSLPEANRFLTDVFIPFWNQRFTVEPRELTDAHRALPQELDLLRLFAETQQRVIRSDFTFRYRNQHYQIASLQGDGRMPGSKITLEHHLDGVLLFRWREQILDPIPVTEPRKPAEPEPVKDTAQPKSASPKPKPSPEHPWRRTRFGRPGYQTRGVSSATLRPDSPKEGELIAISP